MAKRPTPSRGRGGAHPATRTIMIRQVHAYLTAFVAPTILFFAFTGAMQLYHLHESHDGYAPPPLLEKLGRLHKDQTFTVKPPRGPGPLQTPVVKSEGEWVGPAVRSRSDAGKADSGRSDALKALSLACVIALIASTMLGLWMGFTQNRRKAVLVLLFLAGAALPVAILVV